MMKTTISKFAAGLIALAFVTPAAMAEPDEGGEKPGRGKPGAGKPGGERRGGPGGERRRGPSEEERKAALEKYDDNGDGKLDIDERVPMIQDRLAEGGEGAERMKKFFDGNGDGTVTADEIKAAMAKRRPRGGRGPGAGKPDGEKPGGRRPKPTEDVEL